MHGSPWRQTPAGPGHRGSCPAVSQLEAGGGIIIQGSGKLSFADHE